MFIDRTVEFLLSIFLVSVLVVMSVPMDYDGISPQESFAIGFEAGFADGAASVEDIINQWAVELYGVESLEELEAQALEELSEIFGDEMAALLVDAENMSIADVMSLVHEMLMADPLFAELTADIQPIPAELLLALLPEGLRAELAELFTEEMVLDILGGWFVQIIFGAIVQEVGLDALIQEFSAIDIADIDGFSLRDDIDYFIGEDTWEFLVAIDDINARMERIGLEFGTFTGDWLAENIDIFMEGLNALMALANMFALDFDIDSISELPLHFAETDLEERVSFSVSGILSTVIITSDIEDANLNVFIVNTGNNPITVLMETTNLDNLLSETVFEEVLAPGQRFTRQITPDELDEINVLVVVGGTLADVMIGNISNMSAEIALRMTENPL